MATLQIPSMLPFNPHGDQNSINQRWAKWKKRFEYFILASGITEDTIQNALLLHIIGQDTQDNFKWNIQSITRSTWPKFLCKKEHTVWTINILCR